MRDGGLGLLTTTTYRHEQQPSKAGSCESVECRLRNRCIDGAVDGADARRSALRLGVNLRHFIYPVGDARRKREPKGCDTTLGIGSAHRNTAIAGSGRE